MSSEATISHVEIDGAASMAGWPVGWPAIVVDGVELLRGPDDERVRAHLDAPQPGDTSDVYSLLLQGWAVGSGVRATGVEILADDAVHRAAGLTRPRPDVASHLGAGTPVDSGFSLGVSALGLPEEFKLLAQAVLEDGTRAPFAVVRGRVRRTPLPGPDPPEPLLMVTLGRTGSTWLTRLLGSHPSIIAHKPFAYEPRVFSYWAKIVLALGDPRSYMQTLAARLTADRWWLGDDALPFVAQPEPAVNGALGHTAVNALAEFARQQVHAVYGAISRVDDVERAAVFVEKVAPEPSVLQIADWLYPESRRLYLVRDPRDMALSILAYNERNHLPGFGSERVGSPDAFLDEVARSIHDMLELFRADRSGPMLVRYEDVISDPHREMSRIFQAAGVDASSHTVAKVVSAASERLPAMDHHRTSATMSASVGRWREELNADQRAMWTEKFADVLRACGYRLDAGS